MIIAVVVVHLFFAYTRWGRQMQMTGGNEEAARLSGVRVKRVRTAAYVASGLFAAIGGILFAARIGTGAGRCRRLAPNGVCSRGVRRLFGAWSGAAKHYKHLFRGDSDRCSSQRDDDDEFAILYD